MGKVIASYLVRVTLREPDDLEVGEDIQEAPTIATLEGLFIEALLDNITNAAHVTAERLDI